jgi:hypothetical protein
MKNQISKRSMQRRSLINKVLVSMGLSLSLVMALASCSSAEDAPSAEVTKMASGNECSSMWLSSESVYVNFRSVTEEPIFLESVDVDCYDWDGNRNPTVFDHANFLGAGAQTGFKELAMRPVPQSTISGNPVIRPWEMSACTKWGCAEFEPRFVYKFSKNLCNTTKRGQTACDGVSLCTDDPNGEVVVSTAVIKDDETAYGEVTATVNCFISSRQSIIVLDWTKY